MKTVFRAFRLFVLLTVLTGIFYPLAVTFAAKALFPAQSGGSLVYQNGKPAGSALLAQKFASGRYFWSRPSAMDFATVSSGASNYAPTNAQLKKAAQEREAVFRQFNLLDRDRRVPPEMLFASGSGLDPHTSPEAALLQAGRVAKARNVDEQALQHLIKDHIEPPQFGIFGKPRVNVLRLNSALDSQYNDAGR